MSLDVRQCPRMSLNVLIKVKKDRNDLVEWWTFRIFVMLARQASYIKHHQSYIKNHVSNPSLRQGRTGFALPSVEYPRDRHEDPLPLDERLSAAHGRTRSHALQSEAPHFPQARSGSDCEASGGAVKLPRMGILTFSVKPRTASCQTWKCCRIHPKIGNCESCKVAGCKLQVALFLRERKTQPATRNFSRNSFGVRVCVCVPYIYKIKIKKIIYYIELRYTLPRRVGENTT